MDSFGESARKPLCVAFSLSLIHAETLFETARTSGELLQLP